MRPSQYGEMSIKVPAPFAGVNDLGFTAQYRAQSFNEPLRDVPLLFEGAESPMRRLADMLRLLSGAQPDAHSWSDPVMLSDEVVVLAFRDRSVGGDSVAGGGEMADYFLNLVQPVVFTFLRDCASIAHLRLAEVIEMRIKVEHDPVAELALPLQDIVRPNGDRLLFGLAG